MSHHDHTPPTPAAPASTRGAKRSPTSERLQRAAVYLRHAAASPLAWALTASITVALTAAAVIIIAALL